MVDIVSRTQDTALTVVIQEPNGLLQQAWMSMGSVWSGPYTLAVDPTSAPGEPGCKSSISLQTTCKLNRWTPMIPPEVLQGWRFGPLLYIEDIIHIAPFKSQVLWLWFANVARIPNPCKVSLWMSSFWSIFFKSLPHLEKCWNEVHK